MSAPEADYSLSDELLAITSIYDPDTLPTITSYDPPTSTATLHVPHSSAVLLRLAFPATYPNSPPTIPAIISTGTSQSHTWAQQVLAHVRSLLGRAFVPGEPVLFTLISELTDGDGRLRDERQDEPAGAAAAAAAAADADQPSDPPGLAASECPSSREWFASAPLTEKKSTFVAHACAISSPADAQAALGSLLASNPRFARATHNITAYRGRYAGDGGGGGGGELAFRDCDDDGEDAAGGRLLHLLELVGAEGVLVVVSRWYGGVKLGPDRFRLVNQVARESLVRGGWLEEEGGGRKGGKKGR